MTRVKWISLVLCILMVACVPAPVRPLKVAAHKWLGYEPLYLARYINAYDRPVDVIQLPSSTDALRALRNGSVDVAASTLDEALLLKSQGEDLVMLLALNFSNGADLVLARPGTESLTDLRGLRIGADSNGLGALLLAALLDQAGLTQADIRLVKLLPDQQLKAWQNDKVDALVTFEPIATALRKEGAHVLFDSSAVPDLIVDVLVCRRSLFEQRKADLQSLVRGYYQARTFMTNRPADAEAFISQRLRMTPAELQQAYGGVRLPSLQDNLDWVKGSPSPFEQARDRLERMMKEHNLLEHNPDGRLLADADWLQQGRP